LGLDLLLVDTLAFGFQVAGRWGNWWDVRLEPSE